MQDFNVDKSHTYYFSHFRMKVKDPSADGSSAPKVALASLQVPQEKPEPKEPTPPPEEPEPKVLPGTKESTPSTLTTVELQVLSELDSTHFGFVKLKDEAHSRKKEVVIKAVRYLEKFIVQCREKRKQVC